MQPRLLVLIGAILGLVCLLNSIRIFFHPFKHASSAFSSQGVFVPNEAMSKKAEYGREASNELHQRFPGCSDKLPNCSSWAEAKQCALNPSFMLANCAVGYWLGVPLTWTQNDARSRTLGLLCPYSAECEHATVYLILHVREFRNRVEPAWGQPHLNQGRLSYVVGLTYQE